MATGNLFWSRTGATSTTPAVVRLPPDWGELRLFVDAAHLVSVGEAYTAPAVTAVNGIITLSSRGTPTAGTFVIQVLGRGNVLATTSALPYNETAANIKTALVATGYFASGDMTAAGGALPTAVTLTFTGVYASAVPQFNIANSITGGVISSNITTSPKGNGGYGYVEANTQDSWVDNAKSGFRSPFLYIATVTTTGNYRVSAYR